MSGPTDLLEKLRLSIVQNPHPDASQVYWQLHKEQSDALSESAQQYVEEYLRNVQKHHEELGLDVNRQRIDDALLQEQKQDELLLEIVLKQLPSELKPLLVNKDSFALGMLNLPEINAQVMVAINGGWLVVIHEGLYAFFYKIARALATCRIEQGEDGVMKLHDDTLIQFKEVSHLIAETLLNYIHFGLPLSRFLPIDFKASLLGGNLAAKTEIFVVCHELAHQMLGHLETSKRKSILIRNVEVEVPVTNWEQEFEADALGLRLLLEQARTPHDLSMTYAGISFFFQTMVLLEEFTQFQGSNTHPPSSVRLKKIRDYAVLHCPDEAGRKILFKMAEELEFLTAQVWSTFMSWTEGSGGESS